MENNLNNKIKKVKSGAGFTLVETLVAIAIFSMSILGTFTAVQSGLQKSVYVKDQITAFYLVQEAMEYIRNVRDQNALSSISQQMSGFGPVDWLYGLSSDPAEPCYFGRVCSIDAAATLNPVSWCSSGTCPPLNRNTNSNLFGYTSGSGWSATNFRREIQFANTGAPSSREAMVIVTISWSGYTLQVRQLFMNNR